MFGNLVENLGLKEGLAEFKEQFNKDAKTTIANTQFAKERGIDVAKLEEWGQQIQEQAIHRTAELHERTIGRAVDAVESLAQDETLAQLLELKRDSNPEDGISGEAEDRGSPERAMTSASAKTEDLDASRPASSRNDTAEVEPVEPVQVPPEKPPASFRGKMATSQVKLEGELAALRSSRDEALAHVAELEARLAELSAVSDDALGQADEAKQQVLLLRRAVEEKDTAMAELTEAQSKLEEQFGIAKSRLEQNEASFMERVQREVSQKEQELLDEVAYLRKAGEAKERRVQDLQAEKAAMERRFLVKASAGVADSGDVMLEAHTAIARAFGDTSLQHPCLRLLDEPMLKFMALLFKQPIFRRMFVAA